MELYRRISGPFVVCDTSSAGMEEYGSRQYAIVDSHCLWSRPVSMLIGGRYITPTMMAQMAVDAPVKPLVCATCPSSQDILSTQPLFLPLTTDFLPIIGIADAISLLT